MSSAIDVELLGFFLEEAKDYLELWEGNCLKLKKNPSAELLDSLFRVAHNLKGSSRTLGLTDFGNGVHVVEDVIQAVRDKKILLNDDIIAYLLDCFSFFNDWLSQLKSKPDFKADITELTAKSKAYLAGESNVSTHVNAATLAQSNTASSAPVNEATVHNNAQHESNIIAANATVTPEVNKANATASGTANVAQASAAKNDAHEKAGQNKAVSVDETLRVSSRKLDGLIQLVGELSINQSIVSEMMKSQDIDESALRSVQFITKISKEIQDAALSLRMNPLTQLFQRLERTALEISRQLSKEVEIEISGAECELDKQAIETITEPLIHIVRNAVDHGLETTENRLKSGKNKIAKVKINATSNSDGVRISVIDDGRGINRDAVLKKAKEKNLVQDGAQLTDAEVYELLFKPGFSTAEKITDVSGRGVGLDVVRSKMQQVGGKIHIESQFGTGTTFQIQVPLSINIIESVVVRVEDDRVVLPLNEIHEIVSLQDNELSDKSSTQKVLSLRGEVIPLAPLKSLLAGTSLLSAKTSGQDLTAVIVKTDQQKVALTVNRVIGQQSVIIKDILGLNYESPLIAGATVLGDGKPGIILKLGEVAKAVVDKAI